jgi:hypothetical protein
MTRCLSLRQTVQTLRPVSFLLLLLWAERVFAQTHGPTEPPAGAGQMQGTFERTGGPLNLLQPLDDSTKSLNPEPGIDIFFTYFNLSWPLIVGSAAGVGILQALYGGIQIMLSGSDTGRLEEGKSRLLWALAGLLMIGLSGAILETLNPVFFVQS